MPRCCPRVKSLFSRAISTTRRPVAEHAESRSYPPDGYGTSLRRPSSNRAAAECQPVLLRPCHARGWHGTYRRRNGTGPKQRYHGNHWFGPRESWRIIGEPEGGEAWEVQGMLNTARFGDVRPGFDASNSGGRWYPTLITLAEVRVLALGGHSLEGDSRHTNTSMELYDLGTKTWSLVGTVDYPNIPGVAEIPTRDTHSEYPRCHVLRDGTVFVVSNMADGDVHRWTPGNDPLAGPESRMLRRATPTPGTHSLTLRCCWRFATRPNTRPTFWLRTRTAYRIQPLATTPSWTPTAGRNMPGTPTRILSPGDPAANWRSLRFRRHANGKRRRCAHGG